MPYLYVLAAVVLRMISPWNFTPMAALFLFSGSTFRSRRDSLLVPLAALLLSDYVVTHFLHGGRYEWFSPFTWAGFLIVGLIGWTLRERRSAPRIAAASLAGSVIFFLLTNFGVWLQWSMYPKTLDGLVACYAAGLPFFRNTLLGDLAYSGLLFGSWHWLQQRRLVAARQN